MYFEQEVHESANPRYSVNPVRICLSVIISWYKLHMIASRLFYLFIFFSNFIYSIKIFAEFTSFAGILESGFMTLKIYCEAVGIYESGKVF